MGETPVSSITELSTKFLAAIDMATAAGLKGKAKIKAANDIVLNETGHNCLDLLGMDTRGGPEPPPKGLAEVEAFVGACCLVGKCYFAPRVTIYSAYELYCVHSGITPEKEQHFGKLIRQVVPHIGHLYTRGKEKREHCHTGICLKECMESGSHA